MVAVVLAWTGAFSASLAGATTVRQDPTLHSEVLEDPYPGWQSLPEALLAQDFGALAKAVGGNDYAFGGWLAPDGRSLLLLVLLKLPGGYPPGLKGAPAYVRSQFANGVCKTNGGFRATYGVVGSGLSTMGWCKKQYEGGALTFAAATTMTNRQVLLLSIGPHSLSESQLQQIAKKQYPAVH